MVFEAILKDEKFNIMHQYTHGGIAMQIFIFICNFN